MDDQNWLSKCIFIFCTIVTIKNAASIPHAPMSQEDRLMSVLSSKRRHSPSAPAVEDRYQGFYTPGFPRYTDPHNNGRHRSTRPIGFQPPPGRQPSNLPKHPGRMPKPNRMHKSRPTWPTHILPRRNVTSTQHDDFETHFEQTTQPMMPHAGGINPHGGYTDQSAMYPQQGLGGQYNPMGNTGQSNTGVILQSILNPANCVPGGVCPQGGLLGGLGNVLGGGMGSNGFGGGFGGGMGNNGFGGGFGNNGFGGGMGNNGYGGGMDSNGYGGGLGNNGYGGGLGSLGNLFPQGNNGGQSTATSTTTDPFLSLNLDSSNNSTDYSSLDSFGDYGFNMTSSDYGLSLDDSSNSTSTTEGNSTSTTESNSTSSVNVSEKGSATNSTEVIGMSSNSSTTSISSSDSKENETSTDNFGLDSFDFNYGSFDSTSNYGDSDLKFDYGNKDLIFSYDDKDLNNDDYLASDYDD